MQQEVNLIRSDAAAKLLEQEVFIHAREEELQARASVTAYISTGAGCLGTLSGGIAGVQSNLHPNSAVSFGIGAIAFGIPLALLATFLINYFLWPQNHARH